MSCNELEAQANIVLEFKKIKIVSVIFIVITVLALEKVLAISPDCKQGQSQSSC